MKLEITLEQLKQLLEEQKRITTEACLRDSYAYNLESTEGTLKTLPIDKEKFTVQGMKSRYPNDFNVLSKYIPKG